MIREVKMTIKPVGANFFHVYHETRDNYGAWGNKCLIPVSGTLEEIKAERIATQEKFGWTLYDIEENNVLTFWKEF